MIVLDTHAWFWWLTQSPQLPLTARASIDNADTVIIPAIVCWEIALLAAKGRLPAPLSVAVGEFLRAALLYRGTELAPLTPQIAVRAARLGPGFHKDPADRLIAATAIELDAPLVTRDARMRAFAPLKTTW